MSYDTGGYRERWCVPCTDLLGQPQRLIVTFSPDHRSLLLITPVDAVRMNTEQANDLAADLHQAAGQPPTPLETNGETP
jgi:hypothetical protein